MNKELELQTINQWVISPSSQESENLASKSHETRRIPDPYVFLIEEGKLKTLNGTFVESAVARGNPIYDAEFRALLKIQDWADKNSEGVSLWFSPPYSEGYSCLKIVASEILISGSAKVLFNRAILLDVGPETGMRIANYLSEENYATPEALREKPIFLAKGDGWMDLLGIYTDQIRCVRSSQDLIIKKETLSQINVIYSSARFVNMNIYEARNYMEYEARLRGLIGEKADSCAVSGNSAFDALFSGSLAEGPMGSFNCPRCNGSIPSGLGITTCPHCGLTKEEAGSTCG